MHSLCSRVDRGSELIVDGDIRGIPAIVAGMGISLLPGRKLMVLRSQVTNATTWS